MYSSKYILTCSLFEIYILQNLCNLIIKDLILTIIIIIFLTIQIICGFYFCKIKIFIHSSQLIYKLLTYQHINYLSVFYIEVVFMVVIQKYNFFKKYF
jgi:hypothetical protein